MTALLLFLAAIALPPKPAQYVTDRAGILRNASALNEKLADFERQSSDQILVYTDEHLPPNTTIEEMGSEAMRQWGVGQKGKDNGAILFVFTGDRKMRIEVGYGLEGSLTDAKSKRITSTVIKPAFQRGDYDSGVTNGVDAMLAAVRGEEYRGSGLTVAQTQPASIHFPWSFFLFGVFVAFWLIAVRRGWIRAKRAASGDGAGWSSYSDSSSSSSSSSSDSSSSFDGGGGSGGGGGASDSW